MATAMASRHLGHRSATTASLPARMNDGSYRCTACQRGTGTAFYIGATYPKESVRLDGEQQVYERATPTAAIGIDSISARIAAPRFIGG